MGAPALPIIITAAKQGGGMYLVAACWLLLFRTPLLTACRAFATSL